MKKKRNTKNAKFLQLMRKSIVSAVVLGIIAIPLVPTVSWAKTVAFGNDPRHTIDAPLQRQAYDSLRPFDEPLITITFDDGWESIYSNGFPIMQKYSIRSTQYILGGEFDHPSYFSVDQVRSLQAAGHDIGSHTMTHPDLAQLEIDAVQWQLGQSKYELESRFGNIVDFATPKSSFDDVVLSEVKKSYRSHRNTFSDTDQINELDVNVRGAFDIYNIYAYTITEYTTIEDLRRLVAFTKQSNGWLVLNYHQVDDSQAHYAVTPKVLDEQLGYLASENIKMPTMREVLDIVAPLVNDQGKL